MALVTDYIVLLITKELLVLGIVSLILLTIRFRALLSASVDAGGEGRTGDRGERRASHSLALRSDADVGPDLASEGERK